VNISTDSAQVCATDRPVVKATAPTDTPYAPWWVVNNNDKRTGRVNAMRHVLHDLEYEGKDAHVRIEFYAKAAGSPQIELRWTDAQGKRHERKRDLWVLNGPMQPRLVAARTHAGESGPQSLTWLLQADYKDDQYDQWIKLEGKDQVERGIFPAEQARAQLAWLDQMHAAGLYRNELAYSHLNRWRSSSSCRCPSRRRWMRPGPGSTRLSRLRLRHRPGR
jgi:hypothetical protein